MITKIIPRELFVVLFDRCCALAIPGKERLVRGLARDMCNFCKKWNYNIIQNSFSEVLIFQKTREGCGCFRGLSGGSRGKLLESPGKIAGKIFPKREMPQIPGFQARERQTCREPWIHIVRTLSRPTVRGVFWNRQFQPSRVFLNFVSDGSLMLCTFWSESVPIGDWWVPPLWLF